MPSPDKCGTRESLGHHEKDLWNSSHGGKGYSSIGEMFGEMF